MAATNTTLEGLAALLRANNFSVTEFLRRESERQEYLKCRNHGQFLKSWSRGQVDGLYWGIAAFIMLLAAWAAVVYSDTDAEYREFKKNEAVYKIKKQQNAIRDAEEEEHKKKVAKHKYDSKMCLLKTVPLLLFAILADTIQVYTIFTLQYCHHENLISLYWPCWTLLGLGSTVAMLGICLNQFYGLLEQKLPPFGTALGTPVLVVASLGHLIWGWIREQLRGANHNIQMDPEKILSVASASGDLPCGEYVAVLLKEPNIIEFRGLREKDERLCCCSRGDQNPTAQVQAQTAPDQGA